MFNKKQKKGRNVFATRGCTAQCRWAAKLANVHAAFLSRTTGVLYGKTIRGCKGDVREDLYTTLALSFESPSKHASCLYAVLVYECSNHWETMIVKKNAAVMLNAESYIAAIGGLLIVSDGFCVHDGKCEFVDILCLFGSGHGACCFR